MSFLTNRTAQIFRERKTLRSLLSNYLVFSENLDLSLWGSLSEGGCEELLRLVKKAGQFEGPIIEIGTLFGLTTQVIAQCKRADQALISVDNYSWNPFCLPPAHHREFTKRALHFCAKNAHLELYDGSSEDFFASYSGLPPALVFLDGSHEYAHVASEIRHAKRLGARMICGDDYNDAFPDVKRAVGEEFGSDATVRHSIWSVA